MPERLNLSLGSGLGKLVGRAFRIGHLGDFNELMLAGTLSGVEIVATRANYGNRGICELLPGTL